MKRTPQQVGQLIRARRDKLGLSQEQIPGVSSATVGKIERAAADAFRPRQLVALMQALRWPTDAYQRLLDGEDPATWPDTPPPTSAL